MLIQLPWWNRNSGAFSDSEKADLCLVVTGETVCPLGLVVNATQLPAALRAKLEDLRNAAKERGVLAAAASVEG